MMRSLTDTPHQSRADIVEFINNEDNDYNKVLNGNFVGLYCLNSWFGVKINDKNELVDFELSRLKTQFLIKIKKILARLRFPNFIIINALYFLDLVHDYIENSHMHGEEEYPVYYKTKEDNLFLNFIVCLMISNKSSNDFAMKSKYWSRLTKIPIRKINELELVMLNLILKHNPLVLNFNVAKLISFTAKLQSRISPYKLYIDDFNAKFNASATAGTAATSTTTHTQTVGSPEPSNITHASVTSAVTVSVATTPATPASVSSSASSYKPSPTSSYTNSDCSPSIRQIKAETIPRDTLEEYIQTSATGFKTVQTALPNPYHFVEDKQRVYRNNQYSLDVYN